MTWLSSRMCVLAFVSRIRGTSSPAGDHGGLTCTPGGSGCTWSGAGRGWALEHRSPASPHTAPLRTHSLISQAGNSHFHSLTVGIWSNMMLFLSKSFKTFCLKATKLNYSYKCFWICKLGLKSSTLLFLKTNCTCQLFRGGGHKNVTFLHTSFSFFHVYFCFFSHLCSQKIKNSLEHWLRRLDPDVILETCQQRN